MSYSPPDWLSNEFLQDVLREHFKDSNLEICDLLVNKIIINTNANEHNEIYGYASELHQARFCMKRNKHTTSDIFSVIIKEHAKGLTGMIAYKRKLFKREIFAYKEIIPRIEELLLSIGDQSKIAPECYYTTETPEPFLILEDLSLKGFKNYDRAQLLNLDCALMTIEKLAKIHACSIIISAENPKLMEFFQDPPILKQNFKCKIFDDYISASTRLIAEELSHWPGYEEISKKIYKLADNILDKVAEMYEISADNFHVFNLCDLWIDNLLFHWDCFSNRLDNVVMLDFQLAYYGAPSIDLNYFLYGSLNENERKIHLKYLIQQYQRILKETLEKLKYKGRIPTVKDITINMIKNSLQGVIAAFCLTPLIFMDTEKMKMKTEELILYKKNEGKSFLLNNIRNPKYRKFLQCTLEEFELNGFLDD